VEEAEDEVLHGVVEVLAGLGEVARGVVVEVLVLTARNDVAWCKRGYGVDGLAPGAEVAAGGFGEIDMDAVLDGVAGHHKVQVRRMHHRAVIAVRVPHIHEPEVVTFEGEAVAGSRYGCDRGRRDLARPQDIPEDFPGVHVVVHLLDGARMEGPHQRI
jgi:hypothetical protein